MKRLIFTLLTASALLSACGGEATPTVSAVDIQNTAIAAAFTMVAQTQAAIPTATPLPTATASPTPPPTWTPAPTLAVTLGAPPTFTPAAASGDECNKPMASDPAGPDTTVAIRNENKAQTNLSLFLSKTPHGECGYRGYSLGGNQSITVTLPVGCYSAYAWVNDPKNPFTAEGYGLCMNNPDKWTILIKKDGRIELKPP